MNVDKYSLGQLKLALQLTEALRLTVCQSDCRMCVLYGNRECPDHWINSLREAIGLKTEQIEKVEKELMKTPETIVYDGRPFAEYCENLKKQITTEN